MNGMGGGNIFKYIHLYCFMMAESLSMEYAYETVLKWMYVRVAFAVAAHMEP